MSDVRPFPARVVRPEAAPRTVTAMSDAQDDSGVALYGVAVDGAAYDEAPPALYVYRQRDGDVSWTGVVCDVAVRAFADRRVRGHEAVDPLRVEALLWHHARASTPPALVMLVHRAGPVYARTLEAVQQREPLLDFVGPRGYQQTVWRVTEGETAALAAEMGAGELYVADGHHRTAAALEEWRVAGRPDGAGLLSVVHAMDGLDLAAFHRRVSGPVDPAELVALVGAQLEVREVSGPPAPPVGSVGLYVGSRWYDVRLPAARPAGVDGLDASILQTCVLDRLPPAPPGRVRTVEPVSAAEPLGDLVARCDVERGALFTLAPPPPSALVEVADAGEVMPPKTTFFEPKPAAGIFLRDRD